DLGIDRGSAARNAAYRLEELVDLEDAVLQQVAEAVRPLAEEPQRAARLDHLREDEHADVRMLCADLLRGAGAFVRLRRRHPHVDDRDVRLRALDRAMQLGRISDLRRDLEPTFGEDTGEPFAQENGVLCDYDAHGISATIRVPPSGGLAIVR